MTPWLPIAQRRAVYGNVRIAAGKPHIRPKPVDPDVGVVIVSHPNPKAPPGADAEAPVPTEKAA